ncbi:ABC transporter ATP-binding protein [Micromonospora sp. NPDC050187]|uniref:ABC transporter ATP-binding protein n=1 Tax=Micromonospora sp. NPDC050187 TaxID=3364277 RepID=UPI00379B5BFE
MTRPTARRSGRLLLTLLWRRRWAFLADMLIGALFFLVGMVPGLLAREIFDSLGPAVVDAPPVFWLIGALVLVKVVHVSLGIAWMAVDTALRGVLLMTLRHHLFDRIMALPAAQALPVPVGDALNRLLEDVRQVVETLCKRGGLMNLTSSLSFTVVAVVVMIRIDARVTVLVLLPVVAVVLLSYLAGRRVTRFRAEARESAGDVSAFLTEIFTAVQLITLTGARERVVSRLTAMNQVRRRAAVRDSVFFAVLQSSSRFVMALGTGLILVVAGERLRSGEFTVGDLALFTYLLEEVGIGVTVLGDVMRRWRQSKVSAERLARLQGDEPLSALADEPAPRPPASAWVRHDRPDRLRRLEARGLGHRYGHDGFVLEDVDLTLAQGTVTVVTGPVGAGKSTLVQALLGMLPEPRGVVRWNGVEVTDRSAFLRPPRCAYLPQDPQLFSGTVRENILLDMADDDMLTGTAVRLAAFDRDVAAMPAGLDTMVGPRGHRLSGGQRQRLATARTVARRADLLVVDDISSALDQETERLLWDRVTDDVRQTGRTLLVVSNRMPALLRADTIVVLDHGRVVAEGTFATLLAQSPHFRALQPESPGSG